MFGVVLCAAESLGLPLVKPYLEKKNGKEGTNFAVSGARALDPSFFEERGISIPTNYSLSKQLNWFKELLPSLCSSFTGKFSIFFSLRSLCTITNHFLTHLPYTTTVIDIRGSTLKNT